MSPTATKTPPKAPKARNPLTELDQLEQAWREAETRAGEASSKHAEAFNGHRELADQRRRLAHGDPNLVDHLGNPNPDIENNPIRQLDTEAEKLGDVADLQARKDHARRLADAEKGRWSAYVSDNFTEIVHALEPEAEAKVAAVRAAGEQLAAAAADWLGFHARSVELTTPVAWINAQSVPDNGGPTKLKEGAEGLTLPLPLPRLPS
jgi:hypothetical protein